MDNGQYELKPRTVRLSDFTWRRLKRQASKQRKKPSEVARELIEYGVSCPKKS